MVFKTNYRAMRVKSIAEVLQRGGSILQYHSAILSISTYKFYIKLSFVIKTFVFFYFEWPLTVLSLTQSQLEQSFNFGILIV